MRKLKPKAKREIKYNEKREVQAHKKPAQEEIDSIEIRMHLLNLATVVERHQSVWKREKEENDGYLNPYYNILIGRVKNLCRKTYGVAFEGKDEVGNDPWSKAIMVKTMTLCARAFGDPLPLSVDDRQQNLPRGFMGTLGAWASVVKELGSKRLSYLTEKLEIQNEILKIMDFSTKYMEMVYREIMRNELLGGFRI